MKPMTDGELADRILRKIADEAVDWTLQRGGSEGYVTTWIESSAMSLTEEEADYLERIKPSQR